MIGLISSLIVPGIVFLKADVIAAWSFLFCFYFETNIFVVKIINGWIPGILWYWQLLKWSLFGKTQSAEKIEKRVSCVSNLKFNPDFKYFKLAKTTCILGKLCLISVLLTILSIISCFKEQMVKNNLWWKLHFFRMKYALLI